MTTPDGKPTIGPQMRTRPVAGSQQWDEGDYAETRKKAVEHLMDSALRPSPYLMGRDLLFLLHEVGLLPQWPWVEEVTLTARGNGAVAMTIKAIAGPELVDAVMEVRTDGTTGDGGAGGQAEDGPAGRL